MGTGPYTISTIFINNLVIYRGVDLRRSVASPEKLTFTGLLSPRILVADSGRQWKEDGEIETSVTSPGRTQSLPTPLLVPTLPVPSPTEEAVEFSPNLVKEGSVPITLRPVSEGHTKMAGLSQYLDPLTRRSTLFLVMVPEPVGLTGTPYPHLLRPPRVSPRRTSLVKTKPPVTFDEGLLRGTTGSSPRGRESLDLFPSRKPRSPLFPPRL